MVSFISDAKKMRTFDMSKWPFTFTCLVVVFRCGVFAVWMALICFECSVIVQCEMICDVIG